MVNLPHSAFGDRFRQGSYEIPRLFLLVFLQLEYNDMVQNSLLLFFLEV